MRRGGGFAYLVIEDRLVEDEGWMQAITSATRRRQAPLRVLSFLGKLPGASEPVLVQCEDGNDWVLKGKLSANRTFDRALINDQVIGLLGKAISAPVAEARLLSLPQELVAAEPGLQHLLSGTAHGSLWIPDCEEPEDIIHTNLPENRSRFALLAILYGWVHAADRQPIFKTRPPQLVYSVDHGHFITGGLKWTADTLVRSGARPDSRLRRKCQLTSQEIAAACKLLESVDEATIAEAVSTPPDEWGMTIEDRVALAGYLQSRRASLVEIVKQIPRSEP